MKPTYLLFLVALMIATPAAAQRHFELFIDAEGVRRSNDYGYTPGVTEYIPEYDTGGGIGGGVNWFLSERVSVEAKMAALATRMSLQTAGSDYVATIDLGFVNIYPLSLMAQWRPFPDKGFQPYVGAGVTYVIVENVEETASTPSIEFGNPVGLVISGGVRVRFSDRWALFGDARYVPMQIRGTIKFADGDPSEVNERPLLVSFGAAYRF